MKDKILQEQIDKILKIKEACQVMNIDIKDVAFMPEQPYDIALGMEKQVIFTEIAGIRVCNIIGTDNK